MGVYNQNINNDSNETSSGGLLFNARKMRQHIVLHSWLRLRVKYNCKTERRNADRPGQVSGLGNIHSSAGQVSARLLGQFTDSLDVTSVLSDSCYATMKARSRRNILTSKTVFHPPVIVRFIHECVKLYKKSSLSFVCRWRCENFRDDTKYGRVPCSDR